MLVIFAHVPVSETQIKWKFAPQEHFHIYISITTEIYLPSIETLQRNSSYIFLFLIVLPWKINSRVYGQAEIKLSVFVKHTKL